MGKFKMPPVENLLKTKKIYDKMKDPVWVYLEREMRENADKKPYNTKVGNWLKFLKDLRYHYFCEAKAKYKRLCRDCGPVWYYEFSKEQRGILDNLQAYIKEDLLEDVVARVKKALWDLGITIQFPVKMLKSSMEECCGDSGLFLWTLFTKHNKKPPSELLRRYDLNNMLLMSALVFIDIDECTQELAKLTTRVTPTPAKPPKKKPVYTQPQVKYGEYLQQCRVPVYSNHPKALPKPKKPLPLANKIKLKSPESYERLYKKTDFLEKRKQRNIKSELSQRICKYKFWDPPSNLRNTNPEMAAYVLKEKMIKMKAKKRYMKYKPPFENCQFHLGAVAYVRDTPVFLLSSLITLPTGYMIVNGGLIRFGNEFVTQINGMFCQFKENTDKCEKTCNCVAQWEAKVLKYLSITKCDCDHYDYSDPVGVRDASLKYFHPPTRHVPLIFDHAKIYQMDPVAEFVNETFIDAMKSESTVVTLSGGTIQLSALHPRELLKLFLSDLSNTPLLIPHLPQANLLKNLQEWCRKRVQGKISPAKHKQLSLKSQRRWLDLSHIDFRARAYELPFTLNQLKHMNWSHRYMIQDLFNTLLGSFEKRMRKYQMEQSRLWWPTMANDVYPNKEFLDVFFTYMPYRYKDTLVVNPYCPDNVKVTGRTCPIGAAPNKTK